MTPETGASLFGAIRETLGRRVPRDLRAAHPARRRAGVLVPLFLEAGHPWVLFIERSHSVPHHKGQIAFPGGALEPGDRSVEEGVLREVQEEIGLPPGHVEILGRLDDAITVTSNYLIHPLVGVIPYPYPFEPEPAEVQSLVCAPLGIFQPDRAAAQHQVARRPVPGPAFTCGRHVIWGATARILSRLGELCETQIALARWGEMLYK